ncbi:Aerobic cobaltochelatase subunit CobT [BD1-7 clade bacterium]|uniref:Aerobic cobaltochelatase subunit CobT n=1 Tax=BD1-7 clade bacterium TaxID=2029982 RepID=A0A5S9PUR2_9GAMM|nr:Aerobic cobaltochelatase subunit CobT [BD1-7 clade bacterium]
MGRYRLLERERARELDKRVEQFTKGEFDKALQATQRTLSGDEASGSIRIIDSLFGEAIGLTSLALVRALSDLSGLWARHHDEQIQAQLTQRFGNAAFLTWLDVIRIEALASRWLPGLQSNTVALFDCFIEYYGGSVHDKSDGFAVEQLSQLIAIRCLVSTLHTNAQILPANYAEVIPVVRGPSIEPDVLHQYLNDQEAFAGCVLSSFGYQEVEGRLLKPEPQCDSEPVGEDFSDDPEDAQPKLDTQSLEAASESMEIHSDNYVDGYSVFDASYDREIDANTYMRQCGMMAEVRDDETPNALVHRLAKCLQRRLQAMQARDWDHDLEDGRLDARRLAQVVSAPLSAKPYKKERDSTFRETVVTLLVDNSGSMRGESIHVAWQCSCVISQVLERCGVKVEVLGYTTNKKNQPLAQWEASGKPEQPGRLAALNHLVYKSADTPYRRARAGLSLMLNDQLLNENIDGEALLWASHRLIQRREARKILLVISDGKPMDKATRTHNARSFLDDHLIQVVRSIEERGQIELAAIGIGHDVARYYANAVTIYKANELGERLINHLDSLFA